MKNVSSINSFLKVSKEEKLKIQRSFEINDEKVLQDNIDAVIAWYNKEEHLAEGCQYINRNVIERLLVLSKGSVEMTKMKIDKFCTTRGLMPEFTSKRTYEEIETFYKEANIVPLSTLNPTEQMRGVVVQFLNDNFHENSLLTVMRYAFLIAEMRLFYDKAVADVYILDLKHINISLLAKLNPITMLMHLKKAETLATEAYNFKIKKVFVLNATPFVDTILSVVKPLLKNKIAGRIEVLHSYEELYKYFQKENLPEDFGGDEPSLAHRSKQWQELFKTQEAMDLINNSEKIVSDESKRSYHNIMNAEYLGMPGSFRQLLLD